MFIDKKLANEIMSEIKTVMPFYFNIMDSSGRILACTDASRVGTYHQGTHIIAQKGVSELIVKRANQYPGCRMGVVLPIHFAQEIIGFVGIAGKPEEIIIYCRIIQKMAEMLVYESFESSQREMDEQARFLLINTLIVGDLDNLRFDLEEALAQHSLKGRGPFSVGRLKYPAYQEVNPLRMESEFQQAKYEIIKKDILNQLTDQHILAATSKDSCIFISNRSSEKLYCIIESLSEFLKEQYGLPLLATIGNTYDHYPDIPKSYMEASSMLHWLKDHNKSGVWIYNPSILDFILDQISTSHQENLFYFVFSKCNSAEISEFSQFIIAYFECNGSLKHLSEQYFIHKNTVQYKIQKIWKKTNLNMRNNRDLFVLYLVAAGEHAHGSI